MAQPGDALSRLRSNGELQCQPAHEFFCANLHVTCVGPTRIATFAFKVLARGSTASIETPAEAVEFQALYKNAGITWDAQAGSAILTPRGASGYARVQADGRYNIRFYVGPTGVMSIGRCE